MPSDESTPLAIIGRTDQIDFPGLELSDVFVKVDTGALTSSMHCQDVYIKRKGRKTKLHFRLADPYHPKNEEREYVVDDFFKKSVKSSNGLSEERYFITTEVVIFGAAIETEFSLTDRGEMKFPVLIGRKLLEGRYIVDVSQKDLSFKEKK